MNDNDNMNSIRRFLAFVSDRMLLFTIQVVVSGFALGIAVWTTVTFIKRLLLADYDFKNYPWVNIFFHPVENNLFNYVFLCIVLGLYGLVIYIFTGRENIENVRNRLEKMNLPLIFVLLICSIISLVSMPKLPISASIFLSLSVLLIPMFYLINFGRLLIVLTAFLCLLISSEPLSIVIGPVYLMNEYEDIFGETYLKEEKINNKQFLDSISDEDFRSLSLLNYLYSNPSAGDKKAMMKFMESSEILGVSCIEFLAGDMDSIFDSAKKRAISLNIFRDLQVSRLNELPVRDHDKQLIENLRHMDVDRIKRFYLYNRIEYIHQNISRGQINHIGHVLNPINEYLPGKPLKEIYMQYGLGNTFIFKWTMDLFGGPSIDNYYKSYVYYILYFISFLIMLYILFKEWSYVFGGVAFFSLKFFGLGYIALIVAPGIIPTRHIFDTTVIIFSLLFFRHNKLVYLGLAWVFSLLGILVNHQFGIMMAAPLMISISLYVIENLRGMVRFLWLLSLFFLASLIFVIFHLTNIVTLHQTLSYFLLGLFSWPANPIIVVPTMCYLVVSYSFMFLLREERHYLKYVYLLIFMYTQGLLVYFYWSGLINHLFSAIPLAGLQLFLMIYMAEKELFRNTQKVQKLLSILKGATFTILIFTLCLAGALFYKEKILFKKNFVNHKTYNWQFSRANLVTTINPEPIKNSIDLIQKYSTNDKGIYIVSKYDNLLPFLAERYTKMPFFELSWHLFSKRESNQAIEALRSQMPYYLFVDTNIDNYRNDPWAKLFNNAWMVDERISRMERYTRLYEIFKSVSDDYEKIDEGELISVYKRRK